MWFLDILRCPDCGHDVGGAQDALRCSGCQRSFPLRRGQLDLRASPSGSATVTLRAAPSTAVWPPESAPPDGAYRGPLRERTNARHLSILATREGRLDVLDWGCGSAQYRPLVQDELGHRYLGIDIAGDDADVLADAHRLPFQSAAFDHAITNAVLAHLTNPFLAVAELARVLKPGGVFSGSAAFLEPYCPSWRTYFHPSPDGIVHLLTTAGLRVDGLWAQEGWTVFDSLAAIPGPISGPTRWVLRRLSVLERAVGRRRLHPRNIARGGWLRAKQPEEIRRELLAITGQVDFLATKPG